MKDECVDESDDDEEWMESPSRTQCRRLPKSGHDSKAEADVGWRESSAPHEYRLRNLSRECCCLVPLSRTSCKSGTRAQTVSVSSEAAEGLGRPGQDLARYRPSSPGKGGSLRALFPPCPGSGHL